MNGSGFPLKTAGMTGRGRRECLPLTVAPDGSNRGTEGETGMPAPDRCDRGFVIGGLLPTVVIGVRNRGTIKGKRGWSGEFEMQTTLLSSLTTHHSKEGYDP